MPKRLKIDSNELLLKYYQIKFGKFMELFKNELIWNRVSEKLHLEKEFPLFCLEVVVSEGNSGQNQFVFVGLNTKLFFLALSNTDENMSVFLKISFGKIQKLEIYEKERFFIVHSKGKIAITHDGAAYLFKKVYIQLKSIFLSSEMPEIVDPNNIISEIFPLDNAYYLRFLYLSKSMAPDILLNSIRKIFKKGKVTHFDMTRIPESASFIDILLRSLDVDHNISSICVPKSKQKGKLWTYLSKFFLTNHSIRELLTDEYIDESFMGFLESMSNNHELILESICFMDSHINEDNISYILKMLEIKKITRIGFIDCLSNGILQNIFNHVLLNDLSKAIKDISLSGIVDNDIHSILRYFPSIESLNLRDCNIDISRLLMEPNALKSLSITGGTLINHKKIYGNTLSKIYLSSVEANKVSLFALLDEFTQEWVHESLILNEIQFIDETTDIVFNRALSFREISMSNIALGSKWLFCFFNSNCLEVLTFDSFIAKADLEEISNAILGCSSIKSIAFKNFEDISYLLRFIEKISCHKGVISLSLEGQKLSIENTIALAKIVSKFRSLNSLSISKGCFNTYELLEPFFRTVSIRGPPLLVNSPEKILKKLMKHSKIDERQFKVLMDLYYQTINGTSQAVSKDSNDDLSLGDFLPRGLVTTEITINEEQTDWVVDFKPLPRINDALLIDQITHDFSFQSVLNKLKYC